MMTRKSIDTVLFSGAADKLSQREWDWMGLYAGTAEISVTHNFGVRRPVRKTAVNRTVKK